MFMNPIFEKSQELKLQYPAGSVIECGFIDDPVSSIYSGTQGTVLYIDDMAGIHVQLDTGKFTSLFEEDDFFFVKERADSINKIAEKIFSVMERIVPDECYAGMWPDENREERKVAVINDIGDELLDNDSKPYYGQILKDCYQNSAIARKPIKEILSLIKNELAISHNFKNELQRFINNQDKSVLSERTGQR